MKDNRVWIPGEPSTFLTRTEAQWRERVRAGATGLQLSPSRGVKLQFHVSAWHRRGHLFDLDNLVKPIMDVLGRPNVQFLDAAIQLSSSPGVEIHADAPAPTLVTPVLWMPTAIVGSVRHASAHPSLTGIPCFQGDTPLRVCLTTHEPLSITNFDFTGFIKPTIDRLWPVIGGSPARPSDHRIRHLIVTRSKERPSGVSVGIESL